jgi:CDP-paratose 2-epimerase
MACSKAGADLYVLEYARDYGLPAAVVRSSSVYGPGQIGGEEHGWINHIVTRALERRPITIFGDGKQVRDPLHVGDLCDALLLLMERIDEVRGQAFNVGGGPVNSMSVREVLELVSSAVGEPVTVAYTGWRGGEQLYFAADTRKLEQAIGWRSLISAPRGISSLCQSQSQSMMVMAAEEAESERREAGAGTSGHLGWGVTAH